MTRCKVCGHVMEPQPPLGLKLTEHLVRLVLVGIGAELLGAALLYFYLGGTHALE